MKLSPVQRKLLEKMRDGGKLEVWPGFNWSASIRTDPNKIPDSVHANTFFTLYQRGMIQKVDGQHEYANCVQWELTAQGIEALRTVNRE